MHDYVNWLRHASPYINSHRERTFVVMLPGEGVAHPNFGNIVHDLVLLHSLGVRLVLVHGSRPQIEARLSARGLTPHFYRDLRITDAQTLECVIDAVGHLRVAIEARLSMDLAASPMQGARLRVSSGNYVTARPIGVLDGVDYHHTGEVRRIDRKGIGRQLDERNIVLLSPLGYSPTGEIFNLACEDVAMRAAIDLSADKLILFGAEHGLLDESGTLIRELRPQQVPAHLQRLGSNYQAELLDAAAHACRAGVKRSHIVSYAEDGALLTEL
ncbi:amino-acid N-acetyltransferase, partial [Pseudomonas sp. UBA6310]